MHLEIELTPVLYYHLQGIPGSFYIAQFTVHLYCKLLSCTKLRFSHKSSFFALILILLFVIDQFYIDL